MNRTARRSVGEDFNCNHNWPDDCFVQCGDSGIVIGNGSVRRTAFFEAFPKNPKTFIRGEGETVVDAEFSAWNQYQKILNCNNHEFERYRGEMGKCKNCQLALSNYFDPEHTCFICKKEAVNEEYKKNKYCLFHYSEETIKNGCQLKAAPYSFDLEMEKYSYLNALCIKNLFDRNILKKEKSDVEQSRWYDNLMLEFSDFKHLKTIEIADRKLIMGEKFAFDYELENAPELYSRFFDCFLSSKSLISLEQNIIDETIDSLKELMIKTKENYKKE